MTGRDGSNGNRHSRNAKVRQYGFVAGAAVGAFVAAAAMATGSAAPAKADFEELLDPIIQPLLTQLTDPLSSFDPTLGTDLTSWSDTLVADLNSFDTTAASEVTGTSAAASAAQSDSPTSDTYDLPITMNETTEPTVQATVDGANTTDLVDTGSSGLVIPETDLGSNFLTQLEGLIGLGIPSGIGESGYSGGVDYIYLTYDNASVDYATVTPGTDTPGPDLDTTAPVEVEIYSWDPGDPLSLFTNDAFQNFLNDNEVTGILGIGDNTSGGAGESPLEADGFTGVTVDEPQDLLIVSDTNTLANADSVTEQASGSTISGLTETVTNTSNQVVGSGTVSDDVDSGGVYGTIPSSIAPNGVPDGDTITVYDGTTPLYHYTVENDGAIQQPDESPTSVSGNNIDSGYAAYQNEPVYIDYTHDTLTFDSP
jgi:hypothetical protein